MKHDRPDLRDTDSLPRMPPWITPRRADDPDDVAFMSGAALGHLHLVCTHPEVPQPLLRDRMALAAAEACVILNGRPEREAALRDEVHLLRPGDRPGPAGAIYQQWRQAVARRITVKSLHSAMPEHQQMQISRWLEAGQGGPVARAAGVLETVLNDVPRAESTALILADAALARACGWEHPLPLLAIGLKRRDLRATGEDLRLASHRGVLAATTVAIQTAGDLARRARNLRAVAPKLRAKGAGQAVDMFLSRDALAPTALFGWMSDRAARRLCDRLIELDVVRELTGRDTFRLYGL